MYALTSKNNLKDNEYVKCFYGLDYTKQGCVKSFKVIQGWCGSSDNLGDEFIHIPADEVEAVKNFLMTLRD